MTITRKLDHLGRIIIPREFRMKLGAESGDNIDMTQQEDGKIILTIRKKQISCRLCGSGTGLIQSGRGYVCKLCVGEILEAAINHTELTSNEADEKGQAELEALLEAVDEVKEMEAAISERLDQADSIDKRCGSQGIAPLLHFYRQAYFIYVFQNPCESLWGNHLMDFQRGNNSLGH